MEARQVEEECDKVSKALSERLEAHDESRKAAQEKLHEACEGLRAQIDRLEESINSELEEKFTAEDNRLQTALSGIRSAEADDVSKMIQKAKAELLVMQSYDVIERNLLEKEDGHKSNISSLYELKTERRVSPDIFEERENQQI